MKVDENGECYLFLVGIRWHWETETDHLPKSATTNRVASDPSKGGIWSHDGNIFIWWIWSETNLQGYIFLKVFLVRSLPSVVMTNEFISNLYTFIIVNVTQ